MSAEIPHPSTTLGELLRAAGYLDEDALYEAQGLAQVLNVPLLRVLSMGQLVPEDVLRAAQELESGLRGGFIKEADVERAVKFLAPPPVPSLTSEAGIPPHAQDADRNVPFDKPTMPPPTVWEFLALAEVAPRTEELADFFGGDETMRLQDVVAAKYDLTVAEANMALTCYQQISLGKLDVDDAVYAFNYCAEQLKRSVQPVDAAEQLGFRSGIWTIFDVLSGH